MVLDVGALAELLIQYFQTDDRSRVRFRANTFLSPTDVKPLNRIVAGDGRQHVVVASAIAFVELTRKWDEIVSDLLQPHQLAAFLQATPDWFVVDPVDESLLPSLGLVPPEVTMPDGSTKPVEWIDAIHVATSLARENARLVTTDDIMLRAHLVACGGIERGFTNRIGSR